MASPRLIIAFEGHDRSGKTTLLNAYRQMDLYKHLYYDRSFPSKMVYDELAGRGTEIERMMYTLGVQNSIRNDKQFEYIFIHVISTQHLVDQRCIDTNHPPVDVDKTAELFIKKFELLDSVAKVITVLNVGQPINEMVQYIHNQIYGAKK